MLLSSNNTGQGSYNTLEFRDKISMAQIRANKLWNSLKDRWHRIHPNVFLNNVEIRLDISRFRTKNFFQEAQGATILIFVMWHYDVEVDNLEFACLWLQVAFWDFLLQNIQ